MLVSAAAIINPLQNGKPPEQRRQLVAVREVEERRGFVEQDDRGVLGQRAGDHHPLALAVGHAVHGLAGDQRAGERISAEATEYVRGIPVVKVFQQTVYSFKSFHAAILSYRDLASGYAMMCRMPYTLFTVVLNAMFLLLMPLGMLLIGGAANGWAVLADLVFYIFFAPQLAFMMERLMYAVNAQMEAAEAVNKLEAILKEFPLPEPAADSGSKPADSGISFENVTFSYDGSDRPALTNVSFHLPQGEAWALVGPSGGGKTTIARLIPRFFDVQAGAVLLGGRDVRSIPTAELMEQISFVFQEVRLFKKSIRDNIRAARPDATEAEILHAAQLAQCSDILEKTPGGLDAVIGAKGVYLSGGEMQRIALARAILKDAPIVVLDEASSFADPENEAKIQKAFEALMKGKTVLMIAHRLSTVRNMDRILVIRDGEIAEEGKHDELLEKGGVYAAMWEEYQKAAQWKVGGAA